MAVKNIKEHTITKEDRLKIGKDLRNSNVNLKPQIASMGAYNP